MRKLLLTLTLLSTTVCASPEVHIVPSSNWELIASSKLLYIKVYRNIHSGTCYATSMTNTADKQTVSVVPCADFLPAGGAKNMKDRRRWDASRLRRFANYLELKEEFKSDVEEFESDIDWEEVFKQVDEELQ